MSTLITHIHFEFIENTGYEQFDCWVHSEINAVFLGSVDQVDHMCTILNHHHDFQRFIGKHLKEHQYWNKKWQ